MQVSHVSKEMMVEANGGPIDHEMMVYLLFADGCAYLGEAGPRTGELTPKELASGMLWKLLATSIHILWHEHGDVPLRRLHITHEGYARPYDVDQPIQAPTYMWGDMVQSYENDPDSDIVEVLITMIFDRDGSCVAVEPFRYGDHGELKWGTLLTVMETEEFNGMAAEVLKAMWSVVS